MSDTTDTHTYDGYGLLDSQGDARVMAHRVPELGGVALRLALHTLGPGGQSRWIARPVVMERINPNEGRMRVPLVNLSMGAAQQLMDELWTCGLRPTEGTGSAGSLAATQAHLADMRRITGEVLGIDLEAKR